MRSLKLTRNLVAAIWSYGSNLQYYNMVFEHQREKKVINDIFGMDLKDKDIFNSLPTQKPGDKK